MKQFFTKDFFKSNREELYKTITPDSLVVLFSAEQFPKSGDQQYKYRQNSDTYYFTGLTQEKTIIVLHNDAKNNVVNEYAFIVEPNEKMVTWTGHKYLKDEVIEISGIENVYFIDSFGEIISHILKKKIKSIYYSTRSNVRGSQYKNPAAEAWVNAMRKMYSWVEIKDLDPFSMQLRLEKKPQEIAAMQQAIDLTGNAFKEVLEFVKPEVYEFEVEANLYKNIVSKGAQDWAYLPIVASGKNNCILHYCTNRNVCKDGDLLLMDFGAEQDYYAADITRTIPVNGKFTARQKEVYNSVLSVFKQMREKLLPGTTINDLNKECEALIEQELLKLKLITETDIANQTPENPAFKKYFMHGLSHFIGLDVHDTGKKDTVLKKGMILSCEPAIYIAEESIGIRLENDILIDDKPIDLCANIPIEAEDIEALMKK